MSEIRPTGGYPAWASGVSGAAAIVQPTDLQRQLGWQANTAPPAAYFNWLHAQTYQYIKYLDEKLGSPSWGDGSDGVATLAGATGISGFYTLGGQSGVVYKFLRDANFSFLSVSSGYRVDVNQNRVYCSDTLYTKGNPVGVGPGFYPTGLAAHGIIRAGGPNASGSAAGAYGGPYGVYTGMLGVGGSGVSGDLVGTSQGVQPGGSTVHSIGGQGATGGTVVGRTPGGPGTVAPPPSFTSPRTYSPALLGYLWNGAQFAQLQGGAGGGNGGSHGGGGGAGGGGAGVVGIAARRVVLETTLDIMAKGGDGGNSTTNTGSGGGGGGGGGGILLVYGELSVATGPTGFSGAANCPGGYAGAGDVQGGFAGTPGLTGSPGSVYAVQLF